MSETVPIDVPSSPIPVTLLSGFLGSGKTTLLKHILEGDHGLKIAVIINDLASVNIDAKLVQNKDFNINQTKEKIVQLENGCACCTLRSDLVGQLINLAYSGKFQYILIETSGLSEPMSIAQTFTEEFSASLLNTYMNQVESIKNGEATAEEIFSNLDTKEAFGIIQQVIKLGGIHKIAELDTAVTVIDAFNFLTNYESFELATTSDVTALEGSEIQSPNSSITDLLIQQVEFADVILVNKVSEIKDDSILEKIDGIIKTLNPKAKVIKTDYCKVDLKSLLNTKFFSFERVKKMSSWVKSIDDLDEDFQKSKEDHHHDYDHEHDHSGHNHKPGEKCDHDHDEDNHIKKYGINSFIYKSDRPFHPGRLNRLLRDKYLLIKSGEHEEEDDEEEDDEEEEEEDDDDNDENVFAGSKRPDPALPNNHSPPKKVKTEVEMLDNDFPKPSHEQLIKNKKSSIFKDVIRLKGFIWLADSLIQKCELGGSGQLIKFQASGQWFNQFTLPFLTPLVDLFKKIKAGIDINEELEEEPDLSNIHLTKKDFQGICEQLGLEEEDTKEISEKEFGDASNEIVFIGFNLNKEEISRTMDSCLLNDEEWNFLQYLMIDKMGLFTGENGDNEKKLKKLSKPKDYDFVIDETESPLYAIEDLLFSKFGDNYNSFV